MKKMKITNLFATLFISLNVCATANPITQGADSLGLPGDNLDLYGVLDLFKKSENPEEFERALNSSESKLNNLDLNGDGEIDYIRVIDRTDKDVHALVLQIPVNEDESQDVAVIEIEKKDDGTAHVQIVGDEELYGKNYIIEPTDEKNTSSLAPERSSQPASTSQPAVATPAQPSSAPPVVVNVIAWPTVRYMYRPLYAPWVSPWRWRYYPPYWRPWRPVYWSMYHPYWYPHHYYHQRVYVYGVVRAHDMYYSHRVVSRTVYQRRTALRSAPGAQERQRTATEQRVAPRQRSQQPRASAPRSNPNGQRAQPRQSMPRSGGGRAGGGSGGGRRR
jgi:hypothetical protein